jgi:Xaa-Pro dipeptidase
MNKVLACFYMEKYGLDALIATQPISLKYFCGFDCWFTNWLQEWMGKPGSSNSSASLFCIFTRKGKTILIIPTVVAPFSLETSADEIKFFGGIPPVEKSVLKENDQFSIGNEFDEKQVNILKGEIFTDPTAALEKTIKDEGLNNSNIGMEIKGFNNDILSSIKSKLDKCSFRECTEIIRLIRTIKTEKEISILSKSAEINELAMQESVKVIKDNTSFQDAYSKFKKIVESSNGIIEHYIFSTYGCGVSDKKDYSFKKDQIFFIDTGIFYSNYVSDGGTTMFLGNISQKYLDIFKRISEALDIGLESLKIGNNCSSVNNNIVEYLNKNNIYMTDTHGHGVGLQPSEYPVISSNVSKYTYSDGFNESSADFKLEENMIVALEIPYYIYGQCSYIAEVSAVITKNGYKLLTKQDRKNPIFL